MSFTRINQLEQITPLLTEFGLTITDWAIMAAIAGHENDALVKLIDAGAPDDIKAWSRASVETLGYRWSISRQTVVRCLTTLQDKGFIEVKRTRGTRVPDYRRVNSTKIAEMLGRLKGFEAEYKAARYAAPELVDEWGDEVERQLKAADEDLPAADWKGWEAGEDETDDQIWTSPTDEDDGE